MTQEQERRRALIRVLWQKGYPASEIATLAQCSRSLVDRATRRQRDSWRDGQDQEIASLYQETGMRVSEIARAVAMPYRTVYDRLRRLKALD